MSNRNSGTGQCADEQPERVLVRDESQITLDGVRNRQPIAQYDRNPFLTIADCPSRRRESANTALESRNVFFSLAT